VKAPQSATDMKILLIDTCGETGTIALADSAATVASRTATLPGRTASERLLPAIRDLAAPLDSIGGIVVVHGPGSFTGVRVGLSAAKGLCEALNLPLIAISRLAVLAQLADLPPETCVRAVLDAGRAEFYAGVYQDVDCLREALLSRDELLAATATVGQHAVVACEPVVAESLAVLAPRLVIQPTAEAALPLALLRIRDRIFDDIVALDANYLRRTDAEIFAKPRPASLKHSGTAAQ
jgi:tRNA threonylcarbamoyladenosine biosynthesis protein TsaB